MAPGRMTGADPSCLAYFLRSRKGRCYIRCSKDAKHKQVRRSSSSPLPKHRRGVVPEGFQRRCYVWSWFTVVCSQY